MSNRENNYNELEHIKDSNNVRINVSSENTEDNKNQDTTKKVHGNKK